MIKTYLLVALLILSYPHSKVYAQMETIDSPTMEVYSIALARDSTEVKNPTDSTVFTVFIHISLLDTINIDQIAVKLGDKGSPGNKFKHVFKWDVFGDTGEKTNYSRNGNNIILSLGNFTCFRQYEAVVELKQLDGTSIEMKRYSH